MDEQGTWLFGADAWKDPYPNYARLRAQSPWRQDTPGDSDGSALWCFLRHDDVYNGLRDHETFSSKAMGNAPGSEGEPQLVLISDDPPRHTNFRRLVNRAFTPRRIAELEPWITSVSTELLDGMGAGEVDVVKNYTMPLPVKAIARLLGIPGDDYATFKQWTDSFLGGDADSSTGGDRGRDVMAMLAYFGEMVAKRRDAPAADLITALVEAEIEGEKLQDWEVLGFAILLLVAGNETTTNLMGNMLNALAQRPELWKQLREDRSLVERVVEETLRYESPVQVLFRRTLRDVEVNGRLIPTGERVGMFYGAANRDPEAFPEPDEFRLDRDLHNHVGFGMGIHYCLGSPLARAEARITLNQFLDRFAELGPGSSAGVRQTMTPIVFGFRELPLALGA
ncbi:MAG: cytochrome P450 [Tepidiformaceae bacterium]